MPPAFRVLLAAGLAFLQAGGSGHAQAQPAQTPAVVAQVEFPGRLHVPEELLRTTVSLKAGEPFTPQRMEADRRALMSLGFFRSVAAAQRTSGAEAQVAFRVVEWPPVVHIRVLGNSVVDRRSLLEAITTQRGQVLCAPQLQNDIRAIERVYRERGYVARVSEKLLDEAARSGILRFEILEVRIEEVQVEGAPADVVGRARRVLLEVPPALYRPEAVALDQERLLGVRGIRRAAPQVETTSPGRVRIRWLLNQSPGPE